MRIFDRLRSIVNRTTQSFMPSRATRIVYVQSTIAGVRVSPDTALQQGVVWACTQVLSKSVGQLPWRVMQRVDSKSSVIAEGYSLDYLLHTRPNPEMSSMVWRQTMMGHVLLWGNCFSEIERDTAGRVIALWPIEPDRVQIYRRPATNKLYYQVTNQTKGIAEIEPEDMFHVRGLSFDGITGYPVAGYAAQTIGLAMAIERFGAAFFGNNAMPGGFIKNKRTNLSAPARESLLAEVNAKHGGPDQAFKVHYLDDDMDFLQNKVENDKGQFIQSRQNQVEEICRWFGVPPHKVMHLLRSTNNNIEHQGIEFVTDGILPWTTLFEQEADFKLIPTNSRRIYTRMDVRALQRGDLAARSAFYTAMFDRGVFSPNDIREQEGLNPIGPDGDKRFVMSTMMTLENAGELNLDGSPLQAGTTGDPNQDTEAQPGGGSDAGSGDGPSQGG